jgi:hypothetical protein
VVDSWYIWIKGDERGPMRADEIQEWLAQGKATRDDWVWREGLADWVRIGMEPAFTPTLH